MQPFQLWPRAPLKIIKKLSILEERAVQKGLRIILFEKNDVYKSCRVKRTFTFDLSWWLIEFSTVHSSASESIFYSIIVASRRCIKKLSYWFNVVNLGYCCVLFKPAVWKFSKVQRSKFVLCRLSLKQTNKFFTATERMFSYLPVSKFVLFCSVILTSRS